MKNHQVRIKVGFDDTSTDPRLSHDHGQCTGSQSRDVWARSVVAPSTGKGREHEHTDHGRCPPMEPFDDHVVLPAGEPSSEDAVFAERPSICTAVPTAAAAGKAAHPHQRQSGCQGYPTEARCWGHDPEATAALTRRLGYDPESPMVCEANWRSFLAGLKV